MTVDINDDELLKLKELYNTDNNIKILLTTLFDLNLSISSIQYNLYELLAKVIEELENNKVSLPKLPK